METIIITVLTFLGGMLCGYIMPRPVAAIYSKRKELTETDGDK
jgi:hypothetical protein